ncbi:MAG: Ig-like domain repeat protein [Pseudonocardiales bacterium]
MSNRVKDRKIFRRVMAGAVALGASVALLLGGTAVAQAQTPVLGTLTLTPATGLDLSIPSVRTSAGCSAGSDGYNVIVTGPGAFAEGFPVVATTSQGFSTTGPIDTGFNINMRDAATLLSTTIVPGEYPVTFNCINVSTFEVTGTFVGRMFFTSPTSYQTTDPNAPTTTSTTLGVSPASPVTQGTQVTLTATVTPSSATGNVQFTDNGANLGAPVPVSGGTATLNTTALTTGAHSLVAVFTGSAPNISGSTSPAVTYQVNAPVATPTTISLSVNPTGTVPQFTPVVLSSTVAPSAAAGSVQFTDNGANLGAPVPVSGGTATFNATGLAPGEHTFTARFVPVNPALFTASESAPVPLTVTPFTGATATETISTTVNAGALVISVANQGVTLPAPTLLPDGSLLTTSGAINPVTVTDTRAGNPGWSCSGQVTDFSDGASGVINGGNLGWTPNLVDAGPSQTITPGPAVSPALGIAPGATPPPGQGLASSRTLATAASGAGIGTANLGANLALNVPTSTTAGTYSSTLTLTAI